MAELAFLSVIFSKVIPFIIILSILVFFHEFGHFIVARWVGVKVQTFSIGFGRPILSWTDRHETKWAIGWAPLGGYVKMYGDANAASTPQSGSELSEMSEAEKAVSFPHKKLWQRASVVAAGPIANFILAIVIFTALFAVIGQTKTAPSCCTCHLPRYTLLCLIHDHLQITVFMVAMVIMWRKWIGV